MTPGTALVAADAYETFYQYDFPCICTRHHDYQSYVSANVNVAYPINFRQMTVVDAGNGDLRFTYKWDSSTGNPGDLSACTVGEIVTYQGTANPFPFPSPPFPRI